MRRRSMRIAKRCSLPSVGWKLLRKLPETPERDGRELGLQLTLGFSLQSVLSWAAPEAGAAFTRARTTVSADGR